MRRALLGALLTVTTLLSVGAGIACAANDTTTSAAPQDASGHLTLLQQPAWSTFGSDVPMRVRIDGDVARLGISIALHSGVGSRTAFEDTIGKTGLGGRAKFTAAPVSTLPATGDVYTLQGLLHAPSIANVYPVEVELYDLRTHDRVDGFVTYVVAVPATQPGQYAIAEPLALSWMWPVVANPAYLPNGTPDPAVVAQLAPTGRIGRIASLVRAAAGLPVTVVPGPETLESWAALAAGNKDLAASYAALRDSMHAFLASTYVPVDVPSLVAGGLASEVGSELAAGAETLTSLLGVRADARMVAVDPIDSRGINQLRQSGVDRVVVAPSSLAPVASKFTPARPFQLATDGQPMTAVATDPGLASLLDADGSPPALRAQRFLAGLAVVAFEVPGEQRGVVVQMPNTWNVDAPTQTAVATVLDALRASPLVKLESVGTLLDSVPPEPSARSRRESLVRTTQSQRPAPLPVTAHDLHAASDRLDAFRALVAPDDPRVRRGDRALLVALSSVWTGASGHRRAESELAVIDGAINAYVAQIHGPAHPTVTITARRAAIPISFQNTGEEPVRVLVRLQSEKLFFPDGAERVLTLPPHNTTARFAVQTQVSGTFPLIVSVTSPDGRIVFEQTRFTVRSTVVSGVGLLLMLGAGFFLAGWWANHYRRRRRGRREARESGSVPAARGPAAWGRTAPSRGSAG